MKKANSVNIHDAKSNLSRLVDEAANGSEVLIARAGKPVAKLVPLKTDRPPRKPGFLKGKIRIADDFDAPLPRRVIRAFEGRK